MSKFWLYVHINKVNKKKYVGTTTFQTPWLRWKNGKGYMRNKHFAAAIEKYTWKNFDHVYIECKSKKQMYNLEKNYIQLYNSNNPEYGYNKSVGGESGGDKGKNSCTRQYIEEHNKKYYRENIDKIKSYKKEQGKKYYIEHKQKILEYNKQYLKRKLEEDPDYFKKHGKKYYGKYINTRKSYYIKNKEKQSQYQSQYWLDHKDEIREKHRKYRELHKDEINAKHRENYYKNKLKKSEQNIQNI